MWADNAQRDRIFEMIGVDTVTSHRVRGARVEQQRRVLVAGLLVCAALWVAVALLG